MRDNYEVALKAVLAHEGLFSDHPADPGGATMMGVTQRVYDAYRQRMGLGTRSVKFIAHDELRDIYRKQYWDVVKGDELPSGIDYCVFDFAVNSGPTKAVKYLQMALGVAADGIPGQVTLRAAEEADPRIIIAAICDRRMHFLKNLSTFATFGKGWTSRVEGVRKMAMGLTELPVLPPIPDVSAPEIETTEKETTMTATVIWGVIRTILAAVAGYFAADGLFTMEFANEAIAALGVLFVGVWSIVEKMKTPA